MMKSDNQNNDRAAGILKTEFYVKDRYNRPGEFVQRRFKDPLHFLHNLSDLLAYTPDLVRVYFGRAITPRFREMIMLTVVISNDCHA